MFALKMTWRELLFAHWPMEPDALRPLLPVGLPIDVAEGKAWVSVVPFRMTGVGPRGLPGHGFAELNVRTYVRHKGNPGVWFFSLDAASRLGVRIARSRFHLPYFDALMTVRRDGEWIDYQSQRIHEGATPALFDARYRGTGDAKPAEAGTLDHWLTERYCFYTTDAVGRPFRGDIRHEPWPLQPAEVEWRTNAMTGGLGFTLEGPPALVSYSETLKVKASLLQRQR
jgi:uncharacterized protein YqjF (DUF2071 family)